MLCRLCVTLCALTLASGLTVSAQDAAKVAEGKTLYETYKCQKCHLIGGVGSKVSPLDHVATKLSSDDLRKWLVSTDEMTAKLKKKPKVKMKQVAFKSGEVDALMAYMLTLK